MVPEPSRRTLLRTASAAVALSLAGCVTAPATNTDPPATAVATPSSARTDGSTASPTRGEPDCTVDNLVIYNDDTEPLTLTVRIVEGRSRRRSDSPTVTEGDSTPTPDAVFTDTVTVPPDGSTGYDDVPVDDGQRYYRLRVSVEGGPTATDEFQGTELHGNTFVTVGIEGASVAFDHGHGEPVTECVGEGDF